mmetsp:Transcript_28055/g.82165  ORF Transcript_28055/g.82165 Transcript_28055/m.82165 type:complete len:209 (+) Transcript_28055:765-1391(+)
MTSIMLFWRVFPTSTSRIGLTSMSKSKISATSTWVSLSTPLLAGMNRGSGGRSRKASVWVSASASTGRSESSSRYVSVCTSMCTRPSTGGGVRGRMDASILRRASSRFMARSFSLLSLSISLAADWVTTWAAYVLPRTTLRSCMMLFERARSSSSSSRYFGLVRLVGTACGSDAYWKACGGSMVSARASPSTSQPRHGPEAASPGLRR